MANTEIKNALEKIKADAKTYKKGSGGQIDIPKDIVSTLLEKWTENNKKPITLDVKLINKTLGFTKALDGNKCVQIKSKLNDQHSDMLKKDQTFHVGYSFTEERYIFDVVESKKD